MEFREATEADLNFVNQHGLYPPTGKERMDRIDFIYTLDHGDYILGVGGFRIITDTTAWAWIELTEYVGAHLVPTVRVINEYMHDFCKRYNICRLQSWVAKDFAEGLRTVRHFNFEEEYTLKNFLGKGKDAILFVRFFDGE
jgi:hypothetical protein